MKIKSLNALFILSVIGLFLIGSVAASDFDISGKEEAVSNDNVSCKPPAESESKIKNVIILVPDGCSQSVQTLARWYSGKPLQVDNMVTGTVFNLQY